jgi:uncharacterized membrane protein YbhN (UPF0104 family)
MAARSVWKRPWFRIAASLAILAILLLVLPLGELWQALTRVPLALWPAAIAGFLLLHALGAAKWRLVVNRAGGGLTMRQALRFYYAGLFGNTFLPSVVGGDVVRAGLALRETRSKAGVLLGSIVDRTLDVIALATVAGTGVLLLPTALDAQSRGIFLGLAVAFAIAGAAGVLLLVLLPARRFPFKVRRKLVKFRTAGRAIAERPTAMLLALGMGVALQCGLLLMSVSLGHVCGLDAPLRVWLFVWPLAKIAALLPVTQGGLGVREAAQAALFAPFGVPAVLAVAVSLVWQAVLITGGLVGGGVAWLLGRAHHRGFAMSALTVSDDELPTHA